MSQLSDPRSKFLVESEMKERRQEHNKNFK